MREVRAADRPLAFIMADLDKFKLLNDTHGHEAGDKALRLYAETVRECARDRDLLCRWGGEEFVFVLADATTR